ncbi:AAA family ATPase [Pseudomonas syringae]|uniref:AAA family ATPase n=1 Tax=Pseudomonas syringae TaxID=317 RepID=UPI0003F4B2E8|nr:AAA family ATPase [Pseudomonas syringae]
MLEKIICIDNVGVIKKGATRPIDLQKVSLVYADNARGKSTLSSLLQASSSFDARDVIRRKTVAATSDQKVLFRFSPEGAAAAFNAEFDGTVWKGERPNMHVFNQSFVDRNVYASGGVLPEQREALLSLALGDAAVEQRAKYDSQSAVQRECSAKVAAVEGGLQGYRGRLTIPQFIQLIPVPDIDSQLAEADKKISEARASEQILNRPIFRLIEAPTFNFDRARETLESSFESISVGAEKTAKAHFERHKGVSTERWASEGLHHLPDEECPFCGQATAGSELLSAYKMYFDRSYSDHQRRVSDLRAAVSQQLHEQKLAAWHTCNEFNHGLRSIWAESLGIEAIPILEHAVALVMLKEVETELLAIVHLKESNPLTWLDPSEFIGVLARLGELSWATDEFNKQVVELNAQIDAYKAKLSKPDISALEEVRETLLVAKTRQEPPVMELVEQYSKARGELKDAETARDTARADLDELMALTLLEFESAINQWLAKFAAPFQIEELAPTYRGGGLRSEYVLKVRGAKVMVGPGATGELQFHSALSEGDKRTLAFAFFLARLFADPKRSNAIVVLDDVFTSLDKHRRHMTVEAVLGMVKECAQVIALGHDAHFLREIKRRVARKDLAPMLELTLHRDAEDYSRLDSFDLDDYCSSEYYKHYQLVERFIAGDNAVSLLEVAKSLRLLVEGHLHRCFPKKFKEGQTVGEMLGLVRAALHPNPLALLQPLHADLVSFNEFAAAFHHDTSGGYTRTEINSAELLPFAKGALGFIQTRQFR